MGPYLGQSFGNLGMTKSAYSVQMFPEYFSVQLIESGCRTWSHGGPRTLKMQQ
ncbi:similar to hypothetical protein 4931417A20 (predicted), isoform CRA_c [Rattus norvegicus]|uniref:Uncharacterized protein RGD1563448_predicted n=1 Tax=Rattus norvegicus TaxID=10116 RepID=A6HNV7_RAT|nr:similar to hypothetical protein 4931417A20 (predicted), isoform CRA_c [Rattus norvegicus]